MTHMFDEAINALTSVDDILGNCLILRLSCANLFYIV